MRAAHTLALWSIRVVMRQVIITSIGLIQGVMFYAQGLTGFSGYRGG